MVSDEDMLLLANLIVQYIKEDFQDKHLSKNLINTISIEKTNDGIAVVIPAEKYNMPLFIREGIVIHSGRGSYASSLDEVGSIIRLPRSGPGRPNEKKLGNHIGYVDKAIKKAIETWRSMIEEKYEIKNIQE